MENQAELSNIMPSGEKRVPGEAFFQAWWEKCGQQLDLGLFFYQVEGDIVHVDPVLQAWFGMDEAFIRSDDTFWEMLASLAADPALAHREIKKIRKRPGDLPVIQIPSKLAPESILAVHLCALSPDDKEAGFGGFVSKHDRSDAKIKDFINVFDKLMAPARQLATAAQGNLQALAGNLQAWSPAVLDEFLQDTRDDINRLSQFLDLGLSYSKVVNQTLTVHQSVPLIQLLEEIINESGHPTSIAKDVQSDEGGPLLVHTDQAMTRIALRALLKEVMKRAAPGMQLELRLSERDGSAVISLASPRMLPLPGLAAEAAGEKAYELSPELYLAQEILAVQGGTMVFDEREADEGGGLEIEVRLPLAEKAHLQPIRQEWRDLLGQGSERILLAEAQPEYQLRIREALTDLGYRVDLAVDGSTALDLIQTRSPKLVILDRNLPGMDGLLVTQGARRWSAVPIIMISMRESIDDLLYAYRLGVDDYLQKPFLMEELIAKVQVFLSRQEAGLGAVKPEIYQEGSIRIDHGSRQVWVRGNLVQLTPIEYNLLVYLSRHIRQIIPYEQLLEQVWEGPEKGTRQGLFVHIRRLRGKIEVDPKQPQIIGNKWGVGYVFNP